MGASFVRRPDVEAFIRAHPDWADRRIAKAVHAHCLTVRRARRRLNAAGLIPPVHRVYREDGSSYPIGPRSRPPPS